MWVQMFWGAVNYNIYNTKEIKTLPYTKKSVNTIDVFRTLPII